MNWRKVNCKEYDETFQELDNELDLSVYASFTDVNGFDPIGYGYSFSRTIWGAKDNELLKSELKNENPNEELHGEDTVCEHWVNQDSQLVSIDKNE